MRQDGFREGARVNAKAFIALLKISWTKACERRIRRFNLEVILLALSALMILTAWLFIAEWAVSK